ncbi:MAG: Trm112 family protein [Candidatus Omnitrophica bacterium]|nr:Trm112 family protein [Candidatus Omnitrophota bacterium]
MDPKLLEILACPACHGDVVIQNAGNGRDRSPQEDKIVCARCGKKYPIKNGVPVLLANEAE